VWREGLTNFATTSQTEIGSSQKKVTMQGLAMRILAANIVEKGLLWLRIMKKPLWLTINHRRTT
jgi:hypothetical protein